MPAATAPMHQTGHLQGRHLPTPPLAPAVQERRHASDVSLARSEASAREGALAEQLAGCSGAAARAGVLEAQASAAKREAEDAQAQACVWGGGQGVCGCCVGLRGARREAEDAHAHVGGGETRSLWVLWGSWCQGREG
jgi:hypothetical protein